jgi:hypothetical protein
MKNGASHGSESAALLSTNTAAVDSDDPAELGPLSVRAVAVGVTEIWRGEKTRERNAFRKCHTTTRAGTAPEAALVRPAKAQSWICCFH